jgi:hypothetical protein
LNDPEIRRLSACLDILEIFPWDNTVTAANSLIKFFGREVVIGSGFLGCADLPLRGKEVGLLAETKEGTLLVIFGKDKFFLRKTHGLGHFEIMEASQVSKISLVEENGGDVLRINLTAGAEIRIRRKERDYLIEAI